jgi:hypothetical protein
MKICIIGCGTYGSYLIRRLQETHGRKVSITAIDVGNERTMSSSEIGIQADSPNSRAAHYGRYFGLGGTSARWGGQILFFDERDNPKNDPDWTIIIERNKRFRERVITTLLGPGPFAGLLNQDRADIKTGIWLKYRRRNLYRQLTTEQLNGIHIVRNVRVAGFKIVNGSVHSVRWVDDRGRESQLEADRFYLTAGALESCRLLQSDPVLNKPRDLGRNFGDHISTELFEIRGVPPIVDGIDLTPRVFRGNLITQRIVVQTKSGRVGFAHPIINKQVRIFSDLKAALFGRQIRRLNPLALISGFEFLVRFAWNLFVRRRLYVHRNHWSLQFDLEQAFPNTNTVELTSDCDLFGQPIIRVNWLIDPADKSEVDDVRNTLVERLTRSGIKPHIRNSTCADESKMEDVYHPSGIMRMGSDDASVVTMDYRVRGLDNLYHFSTALFPSSRSINPTAAAFCLIEDHLDRWATGAGVDSGSN